MLEGSLDWITFPIDGSNEDRQVRTGRPIGHFSRVIKLLERFAIFRRIQTKKFFKITSRISLYTIPLL